MAAAWLLHHTSAGLVEQNMPAGISGTEARQPVTCMSKDDFELVANDLQLH